PTASALSLRDALPISLILDKTGTLTDGRPQIVAIERLGSVEEAEILRLAAALEQASKHPVAQAVAAAAAARGIALPVPSEVAEVPGEGVAGRVEGHAVVVGGHGFVRERLGLEPAPAPEGAAGAAPVALARAGRRRRRAG